MPPFAVRVAAPLLFAVTPYSRPPLNRVFKNAPRVLPSFVLRWAIVVARRVIRLKRRERAHNGWVLIALVRLFAVVRCLGHYGRAEQQFFLYGLLVVVVAKIGVVPITRPAPTHNVWKFNVLLVPLHQVF